MHPRIALGAIALTSAFLSAQQVIPSTLANFPASSSTGFPFGLGTPARIQYLYEASEIGRTTPMLIRSIEVRADQLANSAAKTGIDLEISFSTTPATVATLSSTFATNRGSNHTASYVRKLTNLPATTAAFIGQYSGPMMLDTPFLYDSAAGNLLIEYDVSTQPAGAWSVDTPFSGAGVQITVGQTCGFNSTSTGGRVGGTLTESMSAGPVSAPALMILGLLEFPTPVPVPSSNGCFLYNSLDITLPLTTSATGTASLVIPVPAGRALRNQSIYCQWAAVSSTPAILTSASRRTLLDDVYSVGRVSNSTSNTSPTGTTPQAGVGLVTRLNL